jgi:hypothetical protein
VPTSCSFSKALSLQLYMWLPLSCCWADHDAVWEPYFSLEVPVDAPPLLSQCGSCRWNHCPCWTGCGSMPMSCSFSKALSLQFHAWFPHFGTFVLTSKFLSK